MRGEVLTKGLFPVGISHLFPNPPESSLPDHKLIAYMYKPLYCLSTPSLDGFAYSQAPR